MSFFSPPLIIINTSSNAKSTSVGVGWRVGDWKCCENLFQILRKDHLNLPVAENVEKESDFSLRNHTH